MSTKITDLGGSMVRPMAIVRLTVNQVSARGDSLSAPSFHTLPIIHF